MLKGYHSITISRNYKASNFGLLIFSDTMENKIVVPQNKNGDPEKASSYANKYDSDTQKRIVKLKES